MKKTMPLPARKPKKLALPPMYADAVKEPPDLPDATSLRKLDLPLSDSELNLVRAAMAVHAASKQPKLTWEGWKLIGRVIEISDRHVRKLAGGQSTGKLYNRHMGEFLRATGFTFIAKNVRWALRQCISRVEDIDAWRETLSANERGHLVTPIDMWSRYCEAEKEGGSRSRRPKVRKSREMPSMLEYCLALEEKIHALEEQRDELQAALTALREDMEP